MKLRWLVVETDMGTQKAWPKYMSYGKPYQRFHRSEPHLQIEVDGKWETVPTEITGRKSPHQKAQEAYETQQAMASMNRRLREKGIIK